MCSRMNVHSSMANDINDLCNHKITKEILYERICKCLEIASEEERNARKNYRSLGSPDKPLSLEEMDVLKRNLYKIGLNIVKKRREDVNQEEKGIFQEIIIQKKRLEQIEILEDRLRAYCFAAFSLFNLKCQGEDMMIYPKRILHYSYSINYIIYFRYEKSLNLQPKDKMAKMIADFDEINKFLEEMKSDFVINLVTDRVNDAPTDLKESEKHYEIAMIGPVEK